MSQALTGSESREQRWRMPLALIAGAGAALLLIGGLLNPTAFFRAYLVGYLFWLGIALGCFAILMLHNLTGGGWGVVLRRLLEASASTLPLLAVLFLPVALGVHHLYIWTDPAHHDAVLAEKAVYLNVPFFLARAAIYFALWGLVAFLLVHGSHHLERSYDSARARRVQLLSGPGLIVYGLGITFAAIDWVMSLEPHWFSSIFGVIVGASQVLSALCFCILLLCLLAEREPLASVMTVELWHDLGNLLLAFVMIWTYVSFSQFLLIWSGNLPEEITWYLHRSEGLWGVIAWLLVLGVFVVPFLALLMRDVKRHPRRLALVAGGVLAFQVVHQYWLVAPSFAATGHEFAAEGEHATPWLWVWLDLAAWATVGAAWLLYFLWRLDAWPLTPRPDPAAAEELQHA
jgi:hypothetical protein